MSSLGHNCAISDSKIDFADQVTLFKTVMAAATQYQFNFEPGFE